MKRWVLLAAAIALVVAGVPASACPLCLGGLAFAPGQQLDVADQAVLAAPVAGGSRWRILEVVKGPARGGPLIAGPVEGTDGAAARAGQPSLLLRHALSPRWFWVGTIGIEYAGWLRQLAATEPRADGTDIDWRGRVALVARHLQDPEPLVADFAYGEIARAPYGALRSLKAGLQLASITR
jgi:hypothetical protein